MKNPATLNDSRPIVWTVSIENHNLYCLYINGTLYVENITLDDFYPLYKRVAA
jgi:hypothetical protein